MDRMLHDTHLFGEDDTDELTFELDIGLENPDDWGKNEIMRDRVDVLIESLTRLGGEVARLRAEVDGILEQNKSLTTSYNRMRAMISEKGTLDLDDFDLACDVISSLETTDDNPLSKKISH